MPRKRIFAEQKPVKGTPTLKSMIGSTVMPNKWSRPNITPEDRVEQIKKRALESTTNKRRALEIPAPSMDPTIRKKGRHEHPMITTTKPKSTNPIHTETAESQITNEVINLDTSTSSSIVSKHDKSGLSCASSIITHDGRKDKTTKDSKLEDSFTEILNRDLDVSIKDGEIPDETKELNVSRPRTSTPKPLEEKAKPSTSIQKLNSSNSRENPTPKYIPEPTQDYPSHDPKISSCQKYVPTSEILFDLYCMVRKANQNVGMAMRNAMIHKKYL